MNFMCLVQHGSLTPAVRARLEAGLSLLASREFPGPGGATFAWMEIAPGCAFTAGEPSKAAIAAATVPAGTARDARARFLAGVCDLWVRETDCHIDDIVASAFDDGAAM
jgi:hypothetical protein